MIQVIAGNQGSGKTKRLIDMANESLKDEHGITVFIDDDKRYMYDLHHDVRFVDMSEFAPVKGSTADVFYGFLCGMIASNFDLSIIYIDALLKICKKTPLADMQNFFEGLNVLSETHSVNFVISISSGLEELPEFVKPYAI